MWAWTYEKIYWTACHQYHAPRRQTIARLIPYLDNYLGTL